MAPVVEQPPGHLRKFKTCHRHDDPGNAHSLTFSCFRRQPFLARDRTRSWLADALLAAQERHQFDIWSYVFMPEHVHLLIWPRDRQYRISSMLQSIKLPVSRRAVAFVHEHVPSFLPRMLDRQPTGKQSYRFWQRGGGYDRNISSASVIWAEIDYIHANPVRRGLSSSQHDWPWSSAGYFTGTGSVPLPPNLGSLPPRPS